MRKIYLFVFILFSFAINSFGQEAITYTGPTSFCTGGSLLLTITGAPAGSSYQWTNGGVNMPVTTQTYLAVSTGYYGAVVTHNGTRDTLSPVAIAADTLPVPNFSFNPNNQCTNIPVQFTNTSSHATRYLWDFGDFPSSSDSSILTNPTHRFIGTDGTGTQNFTVKLVAISNPGCKDSVTSIVTTKKSSGTKLGGTGAVIYDGGGYFTQCVTSSGTFVFTNLSTTIATNTHYRIEWGDGSVAYDSPTFNSVLIHSYSLGTYPLLFIVTGPSGCIDTGFYHVFVGANPGVGLSTPGNTSICTNSTVTFQITGTALNPPGTIYTVSFYDGTPDQVFVHPAPSSITHTFAITSCGTTVGGYPNSFGATVRAENPCGSSAATVAPIYVSLKSKANISFSPSDTVCVETNVKITNTSVLGNNVSNNGCNPGNSVWKITPATGWTLNSGSFGNDFGSGDPTIWNPGSLVLDITFHTVGTYTVKLKAGGNTTCGIDSIIKTICVNPLPVAAFTVDQNIGCTPLLVATNNTPSPSFCGSDRYNWQVGYTNTSGCLPNTGTYSYQAGDSSTSMNPHFIFNDPGIYTITLISIAPAASCSSIISKTVTVKAKPTVTLNAFAPICQSTSITPVSTVLNCYAASGPAYLWSFPGGTPASSTSVNPGSIVYNNSGTYTVTFAVTNECGTTTLTRQLQVDTVTVANAGPDQTLCGSAVTMAGNAAIVGSGIWSYISGPNSYIISNPAAANTQINTLIPGTYIFRWTITNGGCISYSDVTVTIVPGPTPAVAGPDQDLCMTTTATLSGNTPSVGRGLWSLVSGPNAPIITNPYSPVTTVTGMIPGTYFFRWTISLATCSSTTSDVRVTIAMGASNANAGPDQTICLSTATMAANAPASGSGLWSKITGPAGETITNPASPTTTITGLVAGIYIYKWRITSGNCPAFEDTVVINVTGNLSASTAGPDQALCAVTNTTLAGNSPTNGTGVWTFVTGPNTPVITNTLLPNTTVTGLIPGTYIFSWTISNGTCPPSSDSVLVLISANATPANAGPNQILCGSSVTMAGNLAIVGTGAWSYVSGPTGYSITDTSFATTTITGMVPGTYIFKWTITNGGCSSSSNVSITISAGPSNASAGPDQALCMVSSTTLSGNTPTTGTGVWKLISGPNTPLITDTTSAVTTVTGLIPGAYIFQWKISLGNCTPSTSDVHITVSAGPSTANAGPDQAICSATATMSGNVPVTGTGIWSQISGPPGAIITSQSLATTTITALISGTYSFKWRISNGVCPVSEDTVQVTVTGALTPSAAGLDQAFCTQSSTTLAGNTPISGIGLWTSVTGPNSAVITNPASPSSTVTGLIPGTYIFSWTITNGSCPPSSDSVAIVNYANATPSNAGPDQILCGSTATMAGNLPVLGTGKWSRVSGPNSATITDSSLANTTITSLIPGTYVFKWTITNGPCVSSSNVTITIVTGPDVATTGPNQNLCMAVSTIITANTPTIGTGLWSLVSGSNNALITAPTSATTSVTGLTPGVYIFRWTISLSNCTPTTSDVTVTIAAASVANAGPDQIVCSSIATMAANTPVGGSGIWTKISGPSGDLITSPNSPNTTITGLVPGTYLYKWVVSSGTCPFAQDIVSIVVTGPLTPAAAGPDESFCAVTSLLLIGNTPTNGTGLWTTVTGPGSPIITAPTSPITTVTGLVSGTYIFSWTISNGACVPSSDTVVMINYATPTPAVAGPNQTLCGSVVSMAGNTPLIGAGIWRKASGPNSYIIADSTSPTTSISSLVPGSYIFRWTITNGMCVTSSNVSINIVTGPTTANAGPDQNLCVANSTTLSANTPTLGTGVWRMISGPNTPVITDSTAPTTAVTGLITGAYTFEWIISYGNCTPSISDVHLTNTMSPVPNAGPDQTTCSPTVTMAANTPTSGAGTWFLISGPNTPAITSPSSPSTTITGLVSGTYLYKWRIVSGTCPATEDTVQINIGGITPSAAGPDQILCASSSVTLTGNVPGSGSGNWVMVSGPGSPIIASPTSPSTVVTGLIPGTYNFSWIIINGACTPSSDTVTILNRPPLLNVIGPVSDTICSGQSVQLTSVNLSGGSSIYTVQWEQSADGINWSAIQGATSATYIYPGNASTYFRRFVQSSPCSNYSDTTHVIVQAIVSNNIISGDATICINTASPLITGNIPAGGGGNFNYKWEKSIDNGNGWILIQGASSKDYNPGVLSVKTLFRRLVSTNVCTTPLPSNPVTINIHPDAKSSFIPTDTLGCAPFQLTASVVNAQAYPLQDSQYLWYMNNSFIGSGVPFPGYTMSNNNDTLILKLVTTSLYGCANDVTSHTFVTRLRVSPAFSISDSAGCGPLTVQITNTTPNITQWTYQWSFGNGQTSTLAQPGSVVYMPNPLFGDTTYTIHFKTFSICDTITLTRNVVIHSKPKALFTTGGTFGCSPYSVKFTNGSKGGSINTYFWNFGDGTTSTTSSDTFTHVYHTTIRDTFNVTLRVTNSCGLDSAASAIIVTPSTIHSSLTINPNELNSCAPSTIHFMNNSSGATGFLWNFGDGSTLSTSNNVDMVPHTYLQPGLYTVTLLASNSCSDTTSQLVVSVFNKPLANFTADKLSACIGDSIKFTNQSDSATTYLWSFGDGQSSTLLNPMHSYLAPGLYNVILRSSRFNVSGGGCTDTIMKQVSIVGTQPGIFTMSDSIGTCIPFTVHFVNHNLPSLSTSWNFGDGSTGSGDTTSHTYTNPGNYVVILTTTVPGGCQYISQHPVQVSVPTGALQYLGGYACSLQQVRFEAISAGIDSLVWHFGDGTSLSTDQRIVYHTYSAAGSYLPSVLVKLNGGCQFLIPGIDTIKVDKIKAGFVYNQLHNCGTTSLAFTDTSRSYFALTNRHWDFGDGTSGTGPTVNHNYSPSGTYNVRLITTGISGCSDTTMSPILVVVNTKPITSIQADSVSCTFSSVTCIGMVQSADSVDFRSWLSSNGVTSNANPFVVNFSTSGFHTVRYIAGTVNGCYDTSVASIHVYPSPVITASNDVHLCKGSSAQLTVSGGGQYSWSPAQGLSCTTCASPIANPQMTTPYTVTSLNSFGCSAGDSVVVTVSQPFQMVVAGNDSICVNSTSNLLASGATTYLWNPASSLSNATISNPVATPTSTTRYRVVGYDGFNCFTDTAFVTVAVGRYPLVNLGPDLTLATGTVHPLRTVIHNGPIRNWLWTTYLDPACTNCRVGPPNELSCTDCRLPLATIRRDVSYIVQVTNNYGCLATDTINIKVFCEGSQVFIPNAFSPDGDGINDILMVRGTGIASVKSFRIFNRWGELIFEKSNFPPNDPTYGWNGKVKGIAGHPEVYVYTAEVTCENGASFIFKGNTTLVK